MDSQEQSVHRTWVQLLVDSRQKDEAAIALETMWPAPVFHPPGVKEQLS